MYAFSPQLKDGLWEWSSVLEIKNVGVQDYTEYICTATNHRGVLSSTHILVPPTPPPAPVMQVGVPFFFQHFTYWLVGVTSGKPPYNHDYKVYGIFRLDNDIIASISH